MKERLIDRYPRYYEDFGPAHVGTLEPHAYFIPYADMREALRALERAWFEFADERFMSSRQTLLNGTWEFRYFESVGEVPADLFDERAAHEVCTIPVPSVWQNHGFDRHQYTNVCYPIPFDPPYVPAENPCGFYRREFWIEEGELGADYELHFEGVDSSYYVALNGELLGYSEVSHSTSSFDLSGKLRAGRNVLAVLVLKWGVATYLEDQDKFRMSGIFRDVYLLRRPHSRVRDYFVRSDYSAQNGSGTLHIDLSFTEEAKPFRLLLADRQHVRRVRGAETFAADDVLCEIFCEGKTEVEVCLENVAPWSAESPELYALFLEFEDECILEEVGFRSLHIEGNKAEINGRALRLNGTNRHDSDPETGFVIGYDQLLADLLLMKLHNINAIRSSHYPNAPWAYKLYDRLGFYLIDEADMEAHGVMTLRAADFVRRSLPNMILETGSYCQIACDERFAERIIDRSRRCVLRDKNRPSVLMWSMGNESGYGPAFEEAAKWIRSCDPTRPVHYEGSRYQAVGRENDLSNIGVYSSMYTSIEEFEEVFAKKECLDKPFVLCEYIHAMGNGPGGIADYRDLFNRFPNMLGGFIWEWCDHAVDRGRTKDGRKIYAYGGDSGERPHDGNFCVDGMVFPDRRPSSGLREFKNIYRPLRFHRAEGAHPGRILAENPEKWPCVGLKLFWQLRYHGENLAEGMMPLPALQGGESVELYPELPDRIPRGSRLYLASFTDGEGDLPSQRWFHCLLRTKERSRDGADLCSGLRYATDLRGISRDCLPLYDALEKRVGVCHIFGFDCVSFDEVGEAEAGATASSGRERLAGAAGTNHAWLEHRLESFGGVNAGGALSCEEDADEYRLRKGELLIVVNKKRAEMTAFSLRGENILNAPAGWQIWRAPTDNDMHVRGALEGAGYRQANLRVYKSSVSRTAKETTLRFEGAFTAVGLERVLNLRLEYCLDEDACFSVRAEVERQLYPAWSAAEDQKLKEGLRAPRLPRFGLCLPLKLSFTRLHYFGYGPSESYIDRLGNASYDLHSEAADEAFENYIKPQESGSHFGADVLSAESERFCLAVEQRSFCLDGGETVEVAPSLRFSRYSDRELTRKQHNFELEQDPSVLLCLDYRMSGIGSGSCGPALETRYALTEEKFAHQLKFRLAERGADKEK